LAKGAPATHVVTAQAAVIYQARLTTEELRMKRLLRYRTLFGLASLALLVIAVICVAIKIPYEPAIAMFACTVGTFLVFVMKVNDAHQ
jgi:phosphatidylserine synthase